MTCANLMLTPQLIHERYPHVVHVVSMPKLKLRTLVGRNNVQYMKMKVLRCCRSSLEVIEGLTLRDFQTQIWPRRTTNFLFHWRAGLRRRRTMGPNLVLSSLRPEEATHPCLTHQDVSQLERRSRWQGESAS